MQNSKFAELEQVAYKLGAKRYYIEVMEESKESHSSKKEGTLKSALKIPFSANKSTEITDKGYKRSQYAAEAEFENSGEPIRPTLTWFNNDKQLNSLIEMRCSNDEAYRLSTRKLTFDYQSTSAITLETATKIDAAIKDMGFKSNVKREVEEQKRKKLVFNIEF